MEGFGIPTGSVAFHTPQAHQRPERAFFEPTLGSLRREGVHQILDLLLAQFRRKWNVAIRLAQVAVIFGDLVLQDQMVAKCIPSQFRDQAMVLMCVVAEVCENQIRRNGGL